MQIQVINKHSDFKIVEDYAGGAVPKRLVFETDGCTQYEASIENGRMKATSEEGKYVIVFEKPEFHVGRLNVTRYYSEDDADMPDGKYDWAKEQKLPIYIGNSSSDAPDEVVIDAYTPIFRGKDGKDADTEAIVQYVDVQDAKVLADAKEYFDTHSAKVEVENVLYFETVADFDAAKADIAEKSIVYIAETDETTVYKPKRYNAKFVVSDEWVHDTAMISEITGGIDLTGKVMLTMVLNHFESFVVNGTEMVTGSEVANENGMCPLIMDANLGDEFEVTFRFKENNEYEIIKNTFASAGFVFTPITELILREHDFTAYGANSAKIFEAYQMAFNISLHKISICTSQKFGDIAHELEFIGLISYRANYVAIENSGQWRTTPPPEDAYVELSDNDAFGHEFVDGSSETDFGLLTVMTMPKSIIASAIGATEENVYDVELRRIPYIND